MINSFQLPIFVADFHKDQLFSAYISDIHDFAVDFDLFLRADDTSLFCQHKDIDQIKEELTRNVFNLFDSLITC